VKEKEERKKRKAEDESPASKKANDNSQVEDENLNDNEGDSDSEQEGKKNSEDKIEKKVQGPVKCVARQTNMKSMDDKKRAHENESENKLQLVKKRRVTTVMKPECTVMRSFVKKIVLTTTPNSQTKKGMCPSLFYYVNFTVHAFMMHMMHTTHTTTQICSSVGACGLSVWRLWSWPMLSKWSSRTQPPKL
jgi:hypothetical protein